MIYREMVSAIVARCHRPLQDLLPSLGCVSDSVKAAAATEADKREAMETMVRRSIWQFRRYALFTAMLLLDCYFLPEAPAGALC